MGRFKQTISNLIFDLHGEGTVCTVSFEASGTWEYGVLISGKAAGEYLHFSNIALVFEKGVGKGSADLGKGSYEGDWRIDTKYNKCL